MNLFRRNLDTEKMGGTIGHYNLEDWWLTTFSEEEREYLDHVYQPWGERPHLLTEGDKVPPYRTVVTHLSDITRYLRLPQDLFLARLILEKAQQIAEAQGDVEGLDAVYQALIAAMNHAANTERYHNLWNGRPNNAWH